MFTGSFLIGLLFFVLAGWMVYQQFRIAKADGDNDHNWPKTAQLYKGQLRRVYGLGMCLIVIGAVLIALLLVPFPGGLKLADTWVVLPYQQQSIPLLLVVAFSAALVRDVFDRILDQIEEMEALAGAPAPPPADEPWHTRAWTKTTRYLRRHVPTHLRWLWWFLITLAFGLASNIIFENSARLPTSRDIRAKMEQERAVALAAEIAATQPTTAPAPDVTPAAAAAQPTAPNPATTAPATAPTTIPVAAPPGRFAAIWSNETTRLYALVRVPAITILVAFMGMLWFSYREWVRDHIQRKMVRVHKFGPKVVPRFMKDYNQKEVPSQVIIIGPKKAGKSRAFAACGCGPYVPDSTVPIFDWYMQPVQGQHGEFWKLVSLGDMPGENMGDHLHYVRTYRSNRLVIVLSVKALVDDNGEVGAVNDPAHFTLDGFPSLCDQSDGNETSVRTREYMSALKLVLKRHAVGGVGDYDVRGLTILINYSQLDPHQVEAIAQISYEGLSRLASEIAQKFLVPDWHRVDVYVAKVLDNVRLQRWLAAEYLETDPVADAGDDQAPVLVFGGEAIRKPRVWRV